MFNEKWIEKLLFSEDMICYFLKKHNIEWHPGKHWKRDRRWFTEEMGFVAWHLALTKMDTLKLPYEDRPFHLSADYLPEFTNGYNPQDFLHYCGLLGYHLTSYCKGGDNEYANGAVMKIFDCLREVIQDGSFARSGGWKALATYAHTTQQLHIEAKSLAERTLFAVDMIKYFMERAQVRWTPATNGNALEGHRRRFTDTIGSAAWWVSQFQLPASRFTIDENAKRLRISKAYHPGDFLQYCGVMGMSSITQFGKGNVNYPDEAVQDIITYFGEIQKEDTFHLSGGWDELEKTARSFKDYLMTEEIPFALQDRRQANRRQDVQQADEADETEMEMQCIGSLLHNL